VTPPEDQQSARIAAAGCRTAFGDARATRAALAAEKRALQFLPVLGSDGGETAPLALVAGHTLTETVPPNWLFCIDALASEIPPGPWGGPSHPVFVTSSNFGVGSLHAFSRDRDPRHLAYGAPFITVEALRRRLGWGANVAIVSHACVSAHIGLLLASRVLNAGMAERALVFTFDFISPFVAGGFHALKILNGSMPAPYAERPAGSIGLGDGAAFAVLARGGAGPCLSAHSVHNEMHHVTANRADGGGFEACFRPVAGAAAGRRLWIKGHGTGTLEAGRLEAQALARLFPGAPLVSWKGSLGHTLGSCGLVELAIALEAVGAGQAPGTVGGGPPWFADNVAASSFSTRDYDGVLLTSNAFGGAHAAFLLSHD
jgi:hypothetical protein